jgi:hypothetical protein
MQIDRRPVLQNYRRCSDAEPRRAVGPGAVAPRFAKLLPGTRSGRVLQNYFQLLGRGAATRGALAAGSVVADGPLGRDPTVGRIRTGRYRHVPVVLLAYAPGAVSRC